MHLHGVPYIWRSGRLLPEAFWPPEAHYVHTWHVIRTIWSDRMVCVVTSWGPTQAQQHSVERLAAPETHLLPSMPLLSATRVAAGVHCSTNGNRQTILANRTQMQHARMACAGGVSKQPRTTTADWRWIFRPPNIPTARSGQALHTTHPASRFRPACARLSLPCINVHNIGRDAAGAQ